MTTNADSFMTFLREYNPLKPELSMDDIVFFLNEYPDKKFLHPVRNLKPSEITLHERNVLIDFGQGNRIPNEVGVQKIRNLFKLCKYGLLSVLIDDLEVDSSIKKIFDKNHVIDYVNDGGIFVFEKKYGDEPFQGGEAISPYRGKYYVYDFFDLHFDEFMTKLKPGDDFDMQVYDTIMFVSGALNFMEGLQKPETKETQMVTLYEEIQSIIGIARNYGGQVRLSYPIRKYADQYGYFYDTLYHLHSKQKLDIKEISIGGQYVDFVIERIVDFDKRDFETYAKSTDTKNWKSEYDWMRGILRLGGKEFNFRTPSKGNDLLGMFHSIRDKDKNGWIPFGRLSEEYLANKGKYRSVAMSDLNYRSVRDLLKNRLKEIENELKLPKGEEIVRMDTSAITLNY